MQNDPSALQQYKLKIALNDQADLELAILVGSQARADATQDSDWDIAIRWKKSVTPVQQLGKTETLRRMLAKQLSEAETKIDLIDLTSAGLAMRAIVAEEGAVLKGEDSLSWNHFLERTWRDLESYYWDDIYAA
jgi:predicted nucleotidyltransferase